MNKPSLLLALLLALAVTATAVLVGSDDAVEPRGGPGPTSWTPADEDAPPDTDAFAPTAADAESDEDEEAGPPEGLLQIGREEVEAEADGDGRSVVLQVWDGKRGVPAAEAEVFVLDDDGDRGRRDPFALHWSERTENDGRRYRTDAGGRCELPPMRGSVFVAARRPGKFGFARVGRRGRDVETITLQVDETVTVRVVGANGETAADVPVGIVQRVPVREEQDLKRLGREMKRLDDALTQAQRYVRDNPSRREAAAERMRSLRERQARLKGRMTAAKRRATGKDAKRRQAAAAKRATRSGAKNAVVVRTRPELRTRRRTDAEGIAVFRHFQIHRRNRESWWPAENVDRFEAALLLPLPQPETRAFQGRPVPTATIELRLPPTGSIALRPVDRDGRPFTHPVRADLRIHDPLSPPVPWSRIARRTAQNEGPLVFPFVGLGLQAVANCRLDDGDFRWQTPVFAGPTTAGERVTIDLVVAPGDGMLFGQLVDAAGEPLAGAKPTFLINAYGGRLEGEEVTLDDDGRFHLPYQVRPNRHRAPYRLEIRRDDVRPTVGLAMALPALPTDRVTDLGVLQFGTFGAIARGRVVNDLGAPVAGATIQLQRQRDVGRDEPKLEFNDEAFVTARTDENGDFALFGDLERGRYRLRVEARDHFRLDTPALRFGDDAVGTLEMMRRSRVVGTVRKPDGMPSREVRVVLESVLDPSKRRDERLHDHRGRTYVFFDWVEPGVYNVAFRVEDFPDPFLRVDGIRIEPGQQGEHERLTDLDLASFLFRYEIHAVDENARKLQPKTPLLARVVRPDGRAGFVGFGWRNGRVELYSASPQLDVRPLAPGYRSAPTVLGPGRSEVRFLSVPPVELRFAGMRELAGSTPIWIGATPTDTGDLPARLETWDRASRRVARGYRGRRPTFAELGGDDVARVGLTQDGSYELVAYMGRKGRGRTLVELPLGAVDVRIVPGTGPQRLEVAIDAARVQAAMTELAQQRGGGGGD